MSLYLTHPVQIILESRRAQLKEALEGLERWEGSVKDEQRQINAQRTDVVIELEAIENHLREHFA